MAKIGFKSVDEYIAAQPGPTQVILGLVRSAILKAVPGTDEAISYKIPTYKLHGGVVLYFAGWKQHYSLYPASEHLVAAFKDELASYKVDKGTIRLPLSEPVPVKLIERIAKFRAKEAADRAKAKADSPKKRQVSYGASQPSKQPGLKNSATSNQARLSTKSVQHHQIVDEKLGLDHQTFPNLPDVSDGNAIACTRRVHRSLSPPDRHHVIRRAN
jgi:uncharacterized protein YdhG (YjbR/CyaY superfamily)